MTKRLHIGPGFTLPLDAITTSTATFGIRGSGKTNTNVVMVEELLEHELQVAIIDPTDVWWGLKSSKDGTKAGYPILVLGGRHADLPLGAGDGNTIADFVVDTGASVILSLRHFESDAEKGRLVTDFCRRLYHRKGQQDAPSPIKVVIDEASLIVPQRVTGDIARMVGSVQRLVRQGRSSGIGLDLIDARPATVNKDVLAGVEMLVTHRVTSPKDRKAVREYVEQHDPDGTAVAFLEGLAALPQGVAWFWSPGWLEVFESVNVRERRTFDSSRTPKAGEVAIVPTKMADIDLEAVRSKLGQSIERAKAEDPKELKKKIVELETQLRRTDSDRPKVVIDREAVQRATDAAREQERASINKRIRDAIVEDRKRLKPILSALQTAAFGVQHTLEVGGRHQEIAARELERVEQSRAAAATAAQALATELRIAQKEGVAPPMKMSDLPNSVITDADIQIAEQRTEPRNMASGWRKAQNPRAESMNAPPSSLTGARLKIARGLAELEAIGVKEPARKQLAFYVGISLASGYGANMLSSMRTEGLVEYPRDGFVALTDAGRAAAGEVEPPNTLEELREKVRGHLSGLEVKIFDAVVDIGKGRSVSRAEFGERLNVSFGSGYGANTLSRLKTADIVDYPTKGTVGPSDLLFPDGLR